MIETFLLAWLRGCCDVPPTTRALYAMPIRVMANTHERAQRAYAVREWFKGAHDIGAWINMSACFGMDRSMARALFNYHGLSFAPGAIDAHANTYGLRRKPGESDADLLQRVSKEAIGGLA